jgi:paraquat-inducible protein A
MDHMADAGPRPPLTARAAGLIGCRACGKVSAAGSRACPRCGTPLASRMPHSVRRVLVWLALGIACYVPANLLPMLVTRTLFRWQESTILGGVLELARHGAWGIAAIILVASIAIPLAKFAVILHLAWSIRRGTRLAARARVRLWRIVEFVGRWSMIDVFVVAILTALVQFGFLASVNPGPAAAFFALSVAFTMLAARSLDPRLIWDA